MTTTPMQARAVEHLHARAKDAGLKIVCHADSIRICVANKKAYPGMVEEAELARAFSVEEASGIITGLLVARSYIPLWEQAKQQGSVQKKRRSTGK